MWSGADGARRCALERLERRRGQVWLAEASSDRVRRPVVLLNGDAEAAPDSVLLAAPVVISAETGAGRVALDRADGFDGALTIDLRRLASLDAAHLVLPLGAVSDARLAEIDSALGELLGLGLQMAQPATPEANPEAAVEAPAQAVPAKKPSTTNGKVQDGHSFVPPPPPPEPDHAVPPPVVSSRLDDHPIAQLFGQPDPVFRTGAPAPPSPAGSARLGSPARAAAVMPELLEIVRRRLQRSAPRLEAVLGQAADEDRSVEWAAAAVRHSAVRGVTQSTLDDIAREFSAAGVRYSAGR
ncbi:MAG TPA: type II toxin-antitoxin system PemK/MazF family toxin [Candidatus Dormibacteraeota bacterium]